MTTDRLLTDAELELMHVLWDRGPSTAREVLEALSDRRAETRAYTTVATILNILRDKGFVRSDKAGRAFVFAPLTSREAYEATNLRHVVQEVFRGDAASLVRTLVTAEGLDPDELAEIRRLVEGLEP